jgi:hypothetical protein
MQPRNLTMTTEPGTLDPCPDFDLLEEASFSGAEGRTTSTLLDVIRAVKE